MKVYYDKDANLDVIKNLNISIIGYGSQGHAHALNLKDSGVSVTVGLRPNSSNASRAQSEGLEVLSIKDAVSKADIVMILAPSCSEKGHPRHRLHRRCMIILYSTAINI